MHRAQSDVLIKVHTLVPYGYSHEHVPPIQWSRMIDGHRITPHVIHKTLKKCHKAGCDMQYLASLLGVGYAAVLEFLKSEKAVPMSCAEKFYEVFTSGMSFPKARPEEKKSIWDFEFDPDLPTAPEPVVMKHKSPDIDADRLASRLIEERSRRGWTLSDVGKILGIYPGNVLKAEEGQILKVATNKNSVPLRLCNLYQIDIREYELKPRIDYPLFQKLIRKARKTSGKNWDQIAEVAQISRYLLSEYINTKKKRADIVYLEPPMVAVMNVLGVDPAEVVLKGD